MRLVLGAILLLTLALAPGDACAACTTQTICDAGGRCVYCQTCCYGTHCQTLCS